MHPTTRRILQMVLLIVAACALAGCAAMVDTLLGGSESCQDTCGQSYHSCLDQVGMPDAHQYCLSQKNQCVGNC